MPHTPGPWTYDGPYHPDEFYFDGGYWQVWQESIAFFESEIHIICANKPNAAANARLIAAAPELCDTLDGVAFDRHCQLLHNADYEVCDDWLCIASRNVLAKAREEE